MTIGSLIKSKRTKLGISQKDLATKLGITIQRLHNFESGNRVPPLNMLDTLAKELNFNVDNFKKKYNPGLFFNLNLFKNRLITYRKENNLTLQDLSDIINISRQTLSKYEKGEMYPNIDNYYDICRRLKLLPSFFIYENSTKKQNKNTLPLMCFFTFALVTTILLFCNRCFYDENESISPNNSIAEGSFDSKYEGFEKVKIETFNVMTQSSIKLIKDSYSTYNSLLYKENISRPYTININDSHIDNIDFYYTELVFFPLYFDEEKFISHYVDDEGNCFCGLERIDFEKDFSLTPVYITYEEYVNNLIFTVEDGRINIYHSGLSSLFIVPIEINGINDFVIKDFNNGNKVFLANESNITFDGSEMKYVPNVYFINAKNMQFINQDVNYLNIAFVAINQNYNYDQTTNFISTKLVSFLYLKGDNSYSNFINFNDDIDILYLEKGTSLNYLSFIRGNVRFVYTFAIEESQLKHYNKRKKTKC